MIITTPVRIVVLGIALTFFAAPICVAADAVPGRKLPDESAAAVDRGLEWLAKNQAENGSWGIAASDVATTSLAVRAFLARGHRPGKGDYGTQMNKGIDYVLASARKDGVLSRTHNNGSMYEHAFALVMLAQAHGVIDDEARRKRVGEVVKAGVALTLQAQSVRKDALNTGGVRYSTTSPDSDLSVTGGHMVALYAAADTPGVTVPKDAIQAGQDFALRCRFKKGAGFTYQATNGTPSPGRTAIAMVILQRSDKWDEVAAANGDFLVDNPMTNPLMGFYYYSVYYIAQAYHLLGGRHLEEGYPKVRDGLVAAQGKEGHWEKGSGQEFEAGPAYRTSMAVLALCAPLTTPKVEPRPALPGGAPGVEKPDK